MSFYSHFLRKYSIKFATQGAKYKKTIKKRVSNSILLGYQVKYKTAYHQYLREVIMKPEIVAKYLSELKRKTGLTYEAIAEKSERSESAVKNLCLGKAEDPRIDTVASIIYALGGSMDEMLNPNENKDELKETSVMALKDSYEFQSALQKEATELHINNIRLHYQQHHEDLKENYERRLADKRELIDTKDSHIKTLERECLSYKVFSWICVLVLVTILLAELMNPNLGWLRW